MKPYLKLCVTEFHALLHNIFIAKPSFTLVKPIRGTRRGILIAIIILSSFLFFIFAIVLSYQTALETKVMSPLISPIVKYHVYFMVSIGALGVAVGATVFYFMSQKVDSSHDVAQKSAEVMLRFLSKEEQSIVKKLVEKKGKVLQAELTRLPGMDKVKVHRSLQKLIEKRIVELEHYGKTNSVQLQPEILESLT